MIKHIQSIVIIGSGNLAYSLLPAFSESTIELKQLVGRNKKTTKALAQASSIPYTTDWKNINIQADAYLLCVQDDQINQVSKKLSQKIQSDQWILHCSGIKALGSIAHATAGSFYPFNTFAKGIKTDLQATPILVNAPTKPERNTLIALGNKISNSVLYMQAPARAQLHLAAVVAHNFSNYLIGRAESILAAHKIDRTLLQPLLNQMIIALKERPALENQSGPAKRGDIDTIERHMSMLSNSDLLSTYLDISRKINPKIISELDNE